jgi:hypothetical protein
MAKWKDLEDTMKVELDVGVSLVGGSVLVSVGDETQGVKLTRLVTELIESRKNRFGMISGEDMREMEQVQHELQLAASLIGSRAKQERSRMVARGEAL